MEAPLPDKRERDSAVIRWVEQPEADARSRAAAVARAQLTKAKGNAAFVEGEFADALDAWEAALGQLGVHYLPSAAGGGAIMPDSGPRAKKQQLDQRCYPWRAASVLCANVSQAALKLIESSSAEQLGKRRTKTSRTIGELMAYQAFMAAVHAVELDPSYDKAHYRLAAAIQASGDEDGAEHAREIWRDMQMYRAHTSKNVAAKKLDVLADVPDANYPPTERMWPDRLVAYQVGLISARSLWLWGENDLARVYDFLHRAAAPHVQLRCHLAELDTWHSLIRQGIRAGEKNEYGSFEEGGQWLSIALSASSKEVDGRTSSRRFDLEHLWLIRCDTTGAAALDGPGMYSGGTAAAVDAAERIIDSAVAALQAQDLEVSSVLLGQGLKALTKRRGQFGPQLLSGIMMPDLHHEAREAGFSLGFSQLGL